MRDLPDPERAKPCVLVIDDDEAVAWAIAGRLGKDFHVVGLSDPAQAVSKAREVKPGLILCDINMPGMQGDDVAFALSQDPRTSIVPLIYLTALVGPEDDPDLEGVFNNKPTNTKSTTTEEKHDNKTAAHGQPDDDDD